LFGMEVNFYDMKKEEIKVLVACEESQAVCIELRKLGVEAYSCDLLPCSGGYPEWHLQQDVTELLKQDWTAIIAFPPCTDLAVSGARYFADKIADGRQQKSIEFFMLFTKTNCDHVSIENPIGIMSSRFRRPDQIIQPWMFGDKAQKSTCLWLSGLPKLHPTDIVGKGEFFTSPSGRKYAEWHQKTGGGCGVIRSKTFPGIAKAMATQWTEYLLSL
jgi:site-specific DNA-cytosine methylase